MCIGIIPEQKIIGAGRIRSFLAAKNGISFQLY